MFTMHHRHVRRHSCCGETKHASLKKHSPMFTSACTKKSLLTACLHEQRSSSDLRRKKTFEKKSKEAKVGGN